jgi:hypothetical protein
MAQAAELRPLALGELLDKTFTIYRGNFALFFGIAAVPGVFIFGINLLPALMASAGPEAAMATIGIGLIAFYVGYIVAWAVSIGASTIAVSELYLGRSITIGEALSRTSGKIGRIVLIQIAYGLGVGFGLILLVIPGILVAVMYALSIPSAMLENLKGSPAMERSKVLAKGAWGRIFMILLLVVILSYVGAILLQWPLLLLGSAVGSPTAIGVFNGLGSFLGTAIFAPIGNIALALQYYDSRVRKEAFDLQHMMQGLGGASAPAG